jgi:Domain of unknown function (DUF5753)
MVASLHRSAGRQALLTRPDVPKLWAVIDESVLHRPIGGRQVMLTQIEHVLEQDQPRETFAGDYDHATRQVC